MVLPSQLSNPNYHLPPNLCEKYKDALVSPLNWQVQNATLLKRSGKQKPSWSQRNWQGKETSTKNKKLENPNSLKYLKADKLSQWLWSCHQKDSVIIFNNLLFFSLQHQSFCTVKARRTQGTAPGQGSLSNRHTSWAVRHKFTT